MLSYFLKYRENTESKNPKVVKTKKSLSSFGIETPLSKISLVGSVLF